MSTIYRLHVEGDCDSYTCPICAQELEPETLPDPDELDPRKARLYARACVLVAATIRAELPHASATRVAEDLEQRAREYAERSSREHVEGAADAARCICGDPPEGRLVICRSHPGPSGDGDAEADGYSERARHERELADLRAYIDDAARIGNRVLNAQSNGRKTIRIDQVVNP